MCLFRCEVLLGERTVDGVLSGWEIGNKDGDEDEVGREMRGLANRIGV